MCAALTAAAPVAAARTAAGPSSGPSSGPSAGPSGVQARAAAIAVASTGRVLWSRDLHTELPIASITKVMTALVVIRAGDLSRKITVPSAVVGYVEEHDASSAGLRPGDTLTASQLLEGLLLPSGADAAYTLAEAYGPGLSAFIAKMNATAHRLGLTHTHFSNFDAAQLADREPLREVQRWIADHPAADLSVETLAGRASRPTTPALPTAPRPKS